MKTATNPVSTQDAFKLFEPDTLAPEQFYTTLRRTHFVDPERRLMVALLEDAVSRYDLGDRLLLLRNHVHHFTSILCHGHP